MWFGPFDDPTSHAEFTTFKAEWEANGRQLPSDHALEDLTVADLVAAYLEHAKVYNRKPDGTLRPRSANDWTRFRSDRPGDRDM